MAEVVPPLQESVKDPDNAVTVTLWTGVVLIAVIGAENVGMSVCPDVPIAAPPSWACGL